MFDLEAEGRELQGRRSFETSFPVTAPSCRHSGRPVLGVYGGHVRDRKVSHPGAVSRVDQGDRPQRR